MNTPQDQAVINAVVNQFPAVFTCYSSGLYRIASDRCYCIGDQVKLFIERQGDDGEWYNYCTDYPEPWLSQINCKEDPDPQWSWIIDNN